MKYIINYEGSAGIITEFMTSQEDFDLLIKELMESKTKFNYFILPDYKDYNATQADDC